MRYLGMQIKRLEKPIHGTQGFRVVATGRDFPTIRDAKAYIAALVFPYRHGTFSHIRP
jgi:hypothetical protein